MASKSFLKIYYYCVVHDVCGGWQTMLRVEGRGQPLGVISLLLPCWFWELNSYSQAWCQEY